MTTLQIPTFYGIFKVSHSDGKITKLVFPTGAPIKGRQFNFKETKKNQPPFQLNPTAEFAKKIQEDLNNFLSGKAKKINLPYLIDDKATPFIKNVWKAIAKIPYGKTVSYKELAHLAGNEKAIRAAATACGKNNLPLIIPCHRVIASDNTIGGFSANIKWKEFLLSLENQQKTAL